MGVYWKERKEVGESSVSVGVGVEGGEWAIEGKVR